MISPQSVRGFLFVCIMLTSLFNTCWLYRDRRKPANGSHNALLLRQIARDLLHALSQKHDYTWTAFVEPVGTGANKLITF